MKTSSKLRRLQRARKLRRQRSAFLMVLMVIVVMMAHAAFSKPDNISDEYNVISVTVEYGDTLWSIANEYKPEGKDLREFVYEVAANNGIRNCEIVCGQTIFAPVV
jgi:hypothetical protein